MNSQCTWMTQNATLSRVPLKTSHWAVELVEKHHTTPLRMTQKNMLQNLMLPLIFPKKHRPYGCLHLSPGICFRFPGLFLSHLRRHGSGLFSGVDDDRRDESKTTAGPGRNGWASTPKTTLTFNVPKGATKLQKNIDMKWDMLGECTHCGDTWRGKALASHMDFLPLGIFTYTSKHPDFGFVVGKLALHTYKKYTFYDLNQESYGINIPKLINPQLHPASSHLHRRGLLASTVCVPTRLGTF